MDIGFKAKKYDRQLRLWQDSGQIQIEAAKVCLVGASSAGCEFLKNLILPGMLWLEALELIF